MRVLFFGAGPLGSLYAHLLHQGGADVTVLARGERYTWLTENGLVLSNEMTGEQGSSRVAVIDALEPEDDYDLAVILVRKNKLAPVLDSLAQARRVQNMLFMGNNVLGFDQYLARLPADKLLFGFPGAGGGIRDQVVHYADREKRGGKRKAVTIGEVDGQVRERTIAIRSLFESAAIPVDVCPHMDAWLKYHAALISPLAGALYKHDCNSAETAGDREVLRTVIRATREGGGVLKALGFTKGRPAEFRLAAWLPAFFGAMSLRGLFQSRFAEVAFAMHALAARDEMRELALDFRGLAARTSVPTANLEALWRYTLQ